MGDRFEMTRSLLAGIVALHLAVFASAGASGKEQKSWDVSPFLQMDAMSVPRREGGSGLVTVVLNAKDAERIGRICAMMPRIRDAVLRSATRHPVQMVRGSMVTTELANDLPRAINEALRDDLIVAAKVFPGARSTGVTGGASKLPFANKGCYSVPEANFETAVGP
jgi:hypothetical protein